MVFQEFTVVAAVIRNHEGRILLTRRPPGTHMAGLWEFPGGKLKAGESPTVALERELAEELEVRIRCEAPITFAVHEEEGLRILLLFYAAVIVAGTPHALESQEMRWVEASRLVEYAMPPADQRVVAYVSGGTSVPKM